MLFSCKISYNTQYSILGAARKERGEYEVNICHEKDEGISHVQWDELVLPERGTQRQQCRTRHHSLRLNTYV